MKPRAPAPWEFAVFDAATVFTASTMAGRGNRDHREFDNPAAAIAVAKETPRTAVYAVAPSGRSIVLDRADWDMWRERWNTRS